MVFFVNHGSEELSIGNDDAARPFAEGMVAADEMPLDEEIAVKDGGFIDADVKDLVAEVE